ncbi:MAG: hypothetical protein MUO21_06870 [Nitrososphaeraceae archaeon]|nr:hypothetical protein [Nitrososphaeraceae archaeon]
MATPTFTGDEKRYKVFMSLLSNEDNNGYHTKLLTELYGDEIPFKIIPRSIMYMIVDYLLCTDREATIKFACTSSIICGLIEYRMFKDRFDYMRLLTLMRRNGSKRISEAIMKTIMIGEYQDICKMTYTVETAIEYGCVEVLGIILQSRKFRSESVYEMEFSTSRVERLNLSGSAEFPEIIVESRKFRPNREYVMKCIDLAMEHKQYGIIKLLLEHPSFEPSNSESFWTPIFTEKHEEHYFKVEALRNALDNNHNDINRSLSVWRSSVFLCK